MNKILIFFIRKTQFNANYFHVLKNHLNSDVLIFLRVNSSVFKNRSFDISYKCTYFLSLNNAFYYYYLTVKSSLQTLSFQV